ncbi:Epoxide hydrolase 1 [Halotydeus destructor]|nr:Epoxide hydrolase 1 [Halotydeus destructor]
MLSPIMDVIYFMVKESGYMHIQATKPDTVGTALNDSPAGLAAYILEKFSTWVNPAYRDLADGGLTKKFTMDELLTNVMVYWVTETISSSQRFYKENFSYHLEVEVQPNLIKVPNVPVGVAVFPEELLRFPKAPLTDIYGNITQYTIMPRGGHFSAFEEPQLFAQDFRSFVKTTL